MKRDELWCVYKEDVIVEYIINWCTGLSGAMKHGSATAHSKKVHGYVNALLRGDLLSLKRKRSYLTRRLSKARDKARRAFKVTPAANFKKNYVHDTKKKKKKRGSTGRQNSRYTPRVHN